MQIRQLATSRTLPSQVTLPNGQPMPDAEVSLATSLFTPEESDQLFQDLLAEIHWTQETIRIYGKLIPIPRQMAWHGDSGSAYAFSGLALTPHPWIPLLNRIRARVQEAANTEFNSVLLNHYRSGADSMGWHADNEPELGPNPVIASVSFGGTRRFLLRNIANPALRAEVPLTSGSMLLMAGHTQHAWHHHVPRTAREVPPRINLTFRTIIR